MPTSTPASVMSPGLYMFSASIDEPWYTTLGFGGYSPSPTDFANAMAQMRPASSLGFSWVGPSPKVTQNNTGLLSGTQIQLGNPFQITGSADSTMIIGIISSALAQAATRLLPTAQDGTAQDADAVYEDALTHITVDVAPYDPSVRGPISGWADGTIQNQSTSQYVPTPYPTSAVSDTGNNPLGPNAAPRPNDLTNQLDAATSALKFGGLLIAGAAVVYLAWPWLASSSYEQAAGNRDFSRRPSYR